MNKIKVRDPIRELEELILSLEEIKYKVGRENEVCEHYAQEIEYKILVNLRTLHSYLLELRHMEKTI